MRTYDWSSGGASSSRNVRSPSPELDASAIDPQLRTYNGAGLAMARASAFPDWNTAQMPTPVPSHAAPSQASPHTEPRPFTDYSPLPIHSGYHAYPPAAPSGVPSNHALGMHSDRTIWGTGWNMDGHVLEDLYNDVMPQRDNWRPGSAHHPVPPPPVIDPALLFAPPPLSPEALPSVGASATPAPTEDGKENRQTPGPSDGDSHGAHVGRRAKRPRAEPTHQDTAALPDANTKEPPNKRQRRAKNVSEGKVAPRSEEAAPAPRKRRGKAELEKREGQGQTRCGLGGCGRMLSVDDQKGAREHVREHYAGRKPYICSYEDHAGKLCPNSKAYSDMLGLSRHLEADHYKWGFKCQKCGRTYARREVLRAHEKNCKH
ncbi:hypothetical protein OH77DRAFT_1438094 [Trametes cingulata]|nr:hypothetical protein OH77DRAFT_1438094 [Trametes cingulata]